MSTNSTEMYLESNGKKLRIPVLPEKLEITDSANHSSLNVGEVGEILLRQGRKAQVISFSSFFPNVAFQGSDGKVEKPYSYVKTIESWLNNKDIVKLVLTRESSSYLGVSKNMFITSFKYYEEGGDVGTIQYTISFKEYRKITVNKITVTSKKASKKKTSSRTTTKKKAKTYTVKKNDCLWNIAKAQLGSSSKWKSIYNLNKSTIEKAAKKHGFKSSCTGHWIFPGTVLKLPDN